VKHLLNTLYVTTQGAYLFKVRETVSVKVGDEVKITVPIHTLGSIVCFGQVSCSPFLMGFCGERNVEISFLTEHGRFLARVEGPVSGNVLLRRSQYRKADDEVVSTDLARAIVIGKIINTRIVLMRALRDHPNISGTEDIKKVIKRLADIIVKLKKPQSLEWIRGVEGDAAKLYFSVFKHLITCQKDDFSFSGRSKRPPLDNMNALLSFLYTLVTHDVVSALEGVGLDPAVGFLHKDRPGRPSLALDIMEELRPILADRTALTLVNRCQIRSSGFKKTESGAVIMDDETRRVVLHSYQTRKRDEILHPFIEEKIPLGLVPHIQALLLARFLRGDIDGYPPFRWK
jgi:CRISPR-associated protein Cas1